MKKTVWLLCVIGAGLCSCRQNDFRTVRIYVPGMRNEACVKVIVNALGKEQGIPAKDVEADPVEGVVTVMFDALERSVKNLEFTIADAGFAANEVPTTPSAVNALPAECEVPKLPVTDRDAGRRSLQP